MAEPTDLDELRERYPDWTITERWLSAASGPDTRVLRAERGDALITAWIVVELARALRQSA
jgi:alkanesulfonate monooxygenase SsuD/methylene tetrahydromethanopterin reductase-like flavin-dependent oxidoreductase (luciferase family)